MEKGNLSMDDITRKQLILDKLIFLRDNLENEISYSQELIEKSENALKPFDKSSEEELLAEITVISLSETTISSRKVDKTRKTETKGRVLTGGED